MRDPNPSRRFCVHGVADSASRGHVVEEASFEAAALAFVEDHHPVGNHGEDVSLYVEDLDSGERQCFRIDLETGEAAPCG
ncbi:MAG: hypothetical protein DI570_01430 [Phenylobacterium zucineum]|nr:MAG: hypothetical protein DI570_01430 [Phenylobacterium zucineum]